ncbi:MAG: class I SAM-dependent methyltransferase, partial [Elusimicrobia bacterium]|nr:class I SAM-dependent methyltransferase [Elusimicrobiota bacterium]
MILEVGAGRTRGGAGVVTIDRAASTGPDVVHDLDVTPWPLETSSFDVIRCYDVIEHLQDLLS